MRDGQPPASQWISSLIRQGQAGTLLAGYITSGPCLPNRRNEAWAQNHGNEVFSAHVTMLGCKYCCTYRRGFCHIFRVRRGRDKANEQAEWPRGENVSRRRRGKKQRGRASLVGPGPAPPASPRAARDLPTTGGSAQGSGEGLALWLGAPAMSGFGVDGSSELGRARSSRARVGRDDIGAELLFPHEPVTRLPSHPLG